MVSNSLASPSKYWPLPLWPTIWSQWLYWAEFIIQLDRVAARFLHIKQSTSQWVKKNFIFWHSFTKWTANSRIQMWKDIINLHNNCIHNKTQTRENIKVAKGLECDRYKRTAPIIMTSSFSNPHNLPFPPPRNSPSIPSSTPHNNLPLLVGAMSPSYVCYTPCYLFRCNPPPPSAIPMRLFFHACPSTIPAHLPTSHHCQPFHLRASTLSFIMHMFCASFSTILTSSLLFLYMHIAEAFSQPLSFFSISSFRNNYCKWFYNMRFTFRYVHCLI